MSPLLHVTREDVRRAEKRIRSCVPTTPVVHDAQRGAWLKLENLQVTGAYKVRGALNAIRAQLEGGDRRVLVAASAGNHGAGVAWGAQQMGLEAVIVVPNGAPRTKIARIRSLGAEIVEHGENFEESLLMARRLARHLGGRLLHAFDDPDIIAGQGTIGLELLSLQPDVVLVPVGGGGLAAGVSLVTKSANIRLVGVQVEGVDALGSHLRGAGSRITPRETVADGLRVSEAGHLTRSLCQQGLDALVTVTEREVRETMASLAVRGGLIVEGAGAVAVAGLAHVPGRRRVAVVTGGNVDEDVLRDVMATHEPRWMPPSEASGALRP